MLFSQRVLFEPKTWPARAARVMLLCAPLSLAVAPTFSRDVAPIIYAKCATCHHDGGEAPFSLATYADMANGHS